MDIQEISAGMGDYIREDRFVLSIQPVVDLLTGQICGGEVLARLDHPRYGQVMPDDFIGIINGQGLQAEFDLYIFRKSCGWLRRCVDANGPFHNLSVNFSRRTLSQPDLPRMLADIVAQYGLQNRDFGIEITEWERELDTELYRGNLLRLGELGFGLLLDDYGGGVTSFGDLARCPMNLVKIDRSVLADAATARGSVIFRYLVEMAAELGSDVLCEGVETQAQAEIASAFGCRYAQGFLYYHPLDAEKLLETGAPV